MSKKQRQQAIINALSTAGGNATTREIASALKANVNGLSKTLGLMGDTVEKLGGRRGDIRWRLKQAN